MFNNTKLMKSELKGILLMLASITTFAIMSSLVKMVPNVNSYTTVFFRFSVSIGIMSVLGLTKIIKLQFVRSPLLLLRGLTGGIATYLFYLSIVKLGVGKGTVYVYSYPIFATIFSAIFLKERIPMLKWILVIIAFVGIFILSSKSINLNELMSSKYELLAILGSILSALSITIVKKLHKTDSTYAIFFAQATIGFWIFMFPANTISMDITNTQFYILLAIGATAVAGQLVMTEGYRFVPVSTGASMHMMVPIVNLIIAWFIFHEELAPNEILGAAIVIGVCFILPFVRKK